MKYLKRFNESIFSLSGKYKTLNSLIENLINYITENKLFSIVEMNVNRLNDQLHFEFNYDSNRFYIGESITSDMYRFKTKIYEFKINDNVTYVEPEDKEEIFDMLLMYYKTYDYIACYIAYKLNLNRKEAEFKIEEFDIITKDGLDKISLQSLFDFYDNDDNHKSTLDTKEFNKWVGETLIKESNTESVQWLTNKIEDVTKYLNDTLFIEDMVINNTNVVKKAEFKFSNQDVLIYYSHSSNLKISFDNINLEVYDILYHNLHKAIVNNVIRRQFLLRFLEEEVGIIKEDIIDRIIEFELIKNNMIDLISLESLYDFYKNEFDKDDVTIYLSKLSIKYIE